MTAHSSDCSTHNEPAYPNGKCDCSPGPIDRVSRLRAGMSADGVAPKIIDRVVRLNPDWQPGERVCGIHYKRFDDPRTWLGMVGKGQFVESFGREAFDRLGPQDITKRGRRIYVTRQAFAQQVA